MVIEGSDLTEPTANPSKKEAKMRLLAPKTIHLCCSRALAVPLPDVYSPTPSQRLRAGHSFSKA
jgi:hypothetical protein